jgi:hypothetical protein
METIPLAVAPVPPTKILVVQLEAQQWNAVIQALHELPLKVSGPIVNAMIPQLKEQAEKVPGPVTPAAGVVVTPITPPSPAADWLAQQGETGRRSA